MGCWSQLNLVAIEPTTIVYRPSTTGCFTYHLYIWTEPLNSQFLEKIKPLLAWSWRRIPTRIVWRVLWLAAPKFNVGVAGLVVNERGEVLLLRHVFRPADEWAFPAGWVEHGESVEAALHREVMEETGVPIEVGDVIQINSGFRLRVEVYLRASTRATRVERVSAELFEARFFTVDALPINVQPAHRKMMTNIMDTNVDQ